MDSTSLVAESPDEEPDGESAAGLVDALRHSRSLAGLSRSVIEGADPEVIAREVVSRVHDVLDAPIAVVFEITEQQLFLRAAHGWHDAIPEGVPVAPDSQAAYVLTDPLGTVVVDDYATESRFTPAALLTERGIRTSVAMRLGARDAPWGIFSAHWTEASPVDEAAVVFLRELGYILVTAIDRHRHAEQLRVISLQDELTGLGNRRAYEEAVETISGDCHAVLIVDVDNFKAVNDTFGHHAGDAMLVAVAARLAACLPHARLIARIGGDEFAAIVPTTGIPAAGEAEIRSAVSALEAACRRPVYVDGGRIQTSVSIGFTVGGDPLDHQVRCADQALYAAKRAGRARVVAYDRDVHSSITRRTALRDRLCAAVHSGAIEVAYQPIVDLDSGAMHSVEALARWHDEIEGQIPPLVFIPLAEECGVIADLGAVVRRRVVADLARWDKQGTTFSASVNVSAIQLSDPQFPEDVLADLAAAGLAPERLMLEITESQFHVGLDGYASLHRLRNAGLGVAIDDFGAHASNIARLSDLPVSVLKLDRAFITRIERSPARTAAVLAAVVQLAEALGVSVVAEGIETRAQLAAVRHAGCRFGQGFLLCRPAEADALEAWRAARSMPNLSAPDKPGLGEQPQQNAH